ncbi:MAG TPA: ankyrin repeat domain-containing protein [Paracoccaceae bacterium]|nr:ankyrin repeat domain-containing protein [Paracoccaceae bacterium]
MPGGSRCDDAAPPPRPDRAWLRRAAREPLEELRGRDAAAGLDQARLEIARELGFPTWRALEAAAEARCLDGEIVAAAEEGRAEELARLLGKYPGKLGITGGQWERPLLHLAAERGHLDCVERLLRLGADVNERDRLDRATALHWAAAHGHLAVVQLLAAAGADLDGAGDEHELGVIGWATCFERVQKELAEFLLGQGARPTLFAAVALGRADLVRQLVEADPRRVFRQMSRFEHRRTALHLAVLRNLPEMVGLLLDLGADPSARDDRGNSPLNCVSADERIAERLIAAGADPRERGQNRFEFAVPILNVRSVPDAIAYYVEKLGFAKEWDWGTPPSFARVYRDRVRLFLCQGGQGARGTWIAIFVQDVDALYEQYRESGAIIRQPPTNFPWGLREMNVEDLDGHRLRMGSEATGPSDGTALNVAP